MPQINFADGLLNVLTGIGASIDKTTQNTYSDAYLHSDIVKVESLYGHWVGGKVVDSISEDMLSKWITIKVLDDLEFDLEPLNERIDELDLITNLMDSVSSSLVYGGSILFINDGGDYSTPLTTVSQGGITNLVVIDRNDVQVTLNETLSDKRYRKPEYYTTGDGEEIHWSRALHFDGEYVTWRQKRYNCEGWGRSVFDKLNDPIELFDTILKVFKVMGHECNVPVFGLDGLKQLFMANNLEAVKARIQAALTARSVMRGVFLDKDDVYQQYVADLGQWPAVLIQAIELISTASNVPHARFLGTAPSGLSTDGSSQFKNYYDWIKGQQERRLSKPIDTMLDLLFQDVYGSVPLYTWHFNNLFEADQVQEQNIRTQFATESRSYLDAALLTPDVVLRELKKRGYYDITDDYIESVVSGELDISEE